VTGHGCALPRIDDRPASWLRHQAWPFFWTLLQARRKSKAPPAGRVSPSFRPLRGLCRPV